MAATGVFRTNMSCLLPESRGVDKKNDYFLERKHGRETLFVKA